MVKSNWEGLLEGLGLLEDNGKVACSVDAGTHIDDRLEKVSAAKRMVEIEDNRKMELEGRRGIARVRATTLAMQEGKGTLETEAIGEEASQGISDPGPEDASGLRRSVALLDDHVVDGSLWLIRRLSSRRWEDLSLIHI